MAKRQLALMICGAQVTAIVTFVKEPGEAEGEFPADGRKNLYKTAGSGVYGVEVSSDGKDWCERLYESKAAGLILYGRALGLSDGEAEDVLQETFVGMLGLSAPPDEPERYCVRSFRNQALNHRRSLWRRLTREFESQRWFERGEGETSEERAAMRLLAQLPPAQREVIVLKVWNRLTFEEVGALLNISPHTAAGRYRYGLEKIRSGLRGEVYEGDECVGNTFAFLETAPAGGRD